jgi:hypothetical protein
VGGEFVEHRPQPGLVIRQCLVEQPFPGWVEPDRVMFAFPTSTPQNTA